MFALTGLLRPSLASLSSYLQGEGEVASVDRLTDPICQAITSGRVPRRLSPSVATQWNKYALAPVCVGPQRFSHRSSRSRCVCKLLSVKKAQGKRKKKKKKKEKDAVWGGGWGWCCRNTCAVIKALVSSIGWKKCVEGVEPADERAGNTGRNQPRRGWVAERRQMKHNSISLWWLIQNST